LDFLYEEDFLQSNLLQRGGKETAGGEERLLRRYSDFRRKAFLQNRNFFK
jgi:hypothetical protein